MAFCNKIGSLLRHGVSQSAQTPATLFNSIRCMSSSKLFVGGLSYGTDDQSLRDAFSGFGDVVEARVIIDRNTGRSRGFGFVNFSSDDCASSALSAMDGQDLQGRHIRVSYATERSESSGRSFGGGGGGDYRGGDGGFGRGRGGDFDF
ncbi:glycine-rich RNA-binding protein 4, mitochondrial [Ziziphus jujuba]|uniref:Glycine-rich RNA-binding protein 4, mitochondrial n=1 Tax=Ziziphus jujuba TaxID=326968 RepID=A0A6P3ZYI4_ZIZJJ|nr:glycine-rich RNA-binding protein 4, mitochondrial [Ziziphus jujuba]XP_015887195.3 glycine-rich RNA-binding protein 4, mitochondrial [Ziziphus jujuba]